MRLAPLIPQLETAPRLSGRVEVCARIEDAIAQNKTGPWAWLCEPRGQSGENEVANTVRQRHEQRFCVLSLVSRSGDTSGRAAQAEMDELREGILAALLGFTPDPKYQSIIHVRDVSVTRKDDRMYWLDEFKTSHHLRSPR